MRASKLFDARQICPSLLRSLRPRHIGKPVRSAEKTWKTPKICQCDPFSSIFHGYGQYAARRHAARLTWKLTWKRIRQHLQAIGGFSRFPPTAHGSGSLSWLGKKKEAAATTEFLKNLHKEIVWHGETGRIYQWWNAHGYVEATRTSTTLEETHLILWTKLPWLCTLLNVESSRSL